MKHFIILSLALLTFNCVAQDKSFWAEYQGSIHSSYDPLIMTWAYYQDTTSGFGLFNFSLVSPTWAEALVGPMYGTVFGKTYLEVGVGGGYELSEPEYRSTAYVFF